MRRALPILVCALLLGVGALWWSQSEPAAGAAIHQRELILDVVDGPTKNEQIQLDATLYLPRQTPAPAVIVAHGFGGNKNSVRTEATELAERGFVVLAYSARGFGASTGQIALNAPEYEVEDAVQVVNWLSRQPEVSKDGDGDPKVGVTGGSYGGALALMLAGTDRRVDAIAPIITWNDLSQALLPNSATDAAITTTTPAMGAFTANGVFKRAWAGLFFSAGLGPASTADSGPRGEAPEPGTTTSPSVESPGTQGLTGDGPDSTSDGSARPGNGVSSPGELTCGRFRPEVCAAYREVATGKQPSQSTVDLLRRSSPVSVTNKITVPTMLVQGEQDTLFGLDQADANARQIAAAGGKVAMVWYAGGHDGGAPGPALRQRIGAWFDFHLAKRGDDPGAGFEYAVQGSFRRTGGPSVRTVSVAEYPGLTANSPATQRNMIQLQGADQVILNPAGGNPAALSSVPGLSGRVGSGSSSSSLTTGLATDIPGQFAAFNAQSLTEQVLIAGSPQVELTIRSVPGQPSSTEAVLFAKLYEVAKEGQRTLVGGTVAPIRVREIPRDGSPVKVTVTLPGAVRPIAAGNRLQVVVATTDQAFASAVEPAVYRVGLAADSSLAVPIVSGERSAAVVPWSTLIGIGVVLLIALTVGVIAAIRRRRADDVDPDLVDTPLVIRNLTKAYPSKVTAVDGLSFTVHKGQVLGLLGPNGAGKTTSLRMLMGLVQPTAGEIRVFGHLIHSGAPVLSRIGSFVEGSGFLPHLSGIANLHLYWAATGRPTAEAKFDEALEIAGLGNAVRRKVGTYSQGMRQRLAIAQAMLGLPDLLVLDEPANGLDPPQIHHMREVLRKYAESGRTVLVSSHLLAEVEQTCSHVVVMHRGRLVAAGEVAEIVAGGGEVTFRVDRPAEAVAALTQIAGIGEVSEQGQLVHADLGLLPRSVAVAALVQAGIGVEQVGPRRRLEDAFLQLVGEEVVG